MNVRRTDAFIADLECQAEWYTLQAGWPVANAYLAAVETTCTLLGQHPYLGSSVAFRHPRLRDWRFLVVCRPYNKHLLFYEISTGELILRRAMHGYRNLPRRLLESPGNP